MKKAIIMLALFVCIFAFPVCPQAKGTMGISEYVQPFDTIQVKDNVKIVGLGEATHGNKEFQQLKRDVFEALVNHNNCRIFALEGDFGGCAKVNDYILGAIGTDFSQSTFNSLTSAGKATVMTVNHGNALTELFASLTNNINYMDFATANQSPQIEKVLQSIQSMGNIGAEFNDWQKISKVFYTLKMKPARAYNALIFVNTATPSTHQ